MLQECPKPIISSGGDPGLNMEILTDTENSVITNWSYSTNCGVYQYNLSSMPRYITFSSQMFQYQQTGFHYGWAFIIDVQNNKCFRSVNNYNNNVGGLWEEVTLTDYFVITDTYIQFLKTCYYVGTSSSRYYSWYASAGFFY